MPLHFHSETMIRIGARQVILNLLTLEDADCLKIIMKESSYFIDIMVYFVNRQVYLNSQVSSLISSLSKSQNYLNKSQNFLNQVNQAPLEVINEYFDFFTDCFELGSVY
jgi:hypothetical protein